MFALRKVEKSDIRCIFDWANDPLAREMAIHPEPIPWKSHQAWFEQKLQDENCLFYILHEGENNLGSIRFDRKENNEYLISYSIDEKYRGKGLGNLILQKGIQKVVSQVTECSFVAYVLNSNQASSKLFLKNSFQKTGEEIIQNKLFFIYKRLITN